MKDNVSPLENEAPTGLWPPHGHLPHDVLLQPCPFVFKEKILYPLCHFSHLNCLFINSDQFIHLIFFYLTPQIHKLFFKTLYQYVERRHGYTKDEIIDNRLAGRDGWSRYVVPLSIHGVTASFFLKIRFHLPKLSVFNHLFLCYLIMPVVYCQFEQQTLLFQITPITISQHYPHDSWCSHVLEFSQYDAFNLCNLSSTKCHPHKEQTRRTDECLFLDANRQPFLF